MTDRKPGAPGQFKAVITAAELEKLQNSEQFTITLTRDDQPVTEGTPYSKAAVLPDELAAVICPDVTDPTPADALAGLLPRNGGAAMTGALAMGSNKITGLGTPEEDGDASTKKYVDEGLSGKAASSHNHAASAITSGTLGVARGGTGKTTHTTNAVLTGNGTSAVKNVATANGVLYATAANGAPKFGTAPIAQGGTGATTAANARINLGLASLVSYTLPATSGSVADAIKNNWSTFATGTTFMCFITAGSYSFTGWGIKPNANLGFIVVIGTGNTCNYYSYSSGTLSTYAITKG